MDPVVMTAIATVAIAFINAAASVIMLWIKAKYGVSESVNGVARQAPQPGGRANVP